VSKVYSTWYTGNDGAAELMLLLLLQLVLVSVATKQCLQKNKPPLC